jgi:hypothetical protein
MVWFEDWPGLPRHGASCPKQKNEPEQQYCCSGSFGTDPNIY